MKLKKRLEAIEIKLDTAFGVAGRMEMMQTTLDYISNTFAGVIGQLRDDNAQQAKVITQLNIELEKERRNHERNLAQLKKHYESEAELAEHAALKEMEKRKDIAYDERNRVVALLMSYFMDNGFNCFKTKTAIEGWSNDWHNCVVAEWTENGEKYQMSWHIHDSQVWLFDFLKEVPHQDYEYDGHTTAWKYDEIRRMCKL